MAPTHQRRVPRLQDVRPIHTAARAVSQLPFFSWHAVGVGAERTCIDVTCRYIFSHPDNANIWLRRGSFYVLRTWGFPPTRDVLAQIRTFGLALAWALIRTKALPFLSPFFLLLARNNFNGGLQPLLSLSLIKRIDPGAYAILNGWPKSERDEIDRSNAGLMQVLIEMELPVCYTPPLCILLTPCKLDTLAQRSPEAHVHLTEAIHSYVLLGVNLKRESAIPDEWKSFVSGFNTPMLHGSTLDYVRTMAALQRTLTSSCRHSTLSTSSSLCPASPPNVRLFGRSPACSSSKPTSLATEKSWARSKACSCIT